MKLSWDYIAGFFDGEGNVRPTHFHKWSTGGQVSLYQSGERGRILLEEIRTFLLANGLHQIPKVARTPWKRMATMPSYRLDINTREDVETFLKRILPRVHIKKLEAQDLLRNLIIFPAFIKKARTTNLEEKIW